MALRIDFLGQLLSHMRQGTTVWWMDETSTNLWERLHRIWQPRGRFTVKKSYGAQRSVTVIGALCGEPAQFFAVIAPTTNADNVEDFLKKMAAKHDLRGSVMVMDNHRAHLSYRVKDLLKQIQCQPLFLPPASSIFNPIETLWSSVKRRWR